MPLPDFTLAASSQGDDWHDFLLTLVNCHGQFRKHANALQTQPAVHAVTRNWNMQSFPSAWRLDDFVYAELKSGEALHWVLEVTVSNDNVTVEAEVTRIDHTGKKLLSEKLEIGTFDCQTKADCCQSLPAIVDRLCLLNFGLLNSYL